MGSDEGMSDLDLDETVFNIFKDFMARWAECLLNLLVFQYFMARICELNEPIPITEIFSKMIIEN